MRILILLTFLFNITTLTAQNNIKTKIDSIVNLQKIEKGNPGFTVGVFKGNQLIYHGHRGLANLEYDIPFNENTVIGLASITKQFTAACIAILEKQQKLSVNDDVRKYIPELKFYGDTIRIRHLLNHTSGIRNHNVLLDLQGFDLKHRGYTNAMIEELMFQQKGVNNKPGEKVLYSNTNYVLTALIIKRVAGKSIDEFAKEEIFEPLGMTQTFYSNNLERVIKNRAYSYYKRNGVYQQPKSLTLCVGAGGMGTTILDMAKWLELLLHPQGALAYIPAFLAVQNPLLDGNQVSSARGVFVAPYRGYKTVNHGGRGLGMRSQLLVVPELDIAVIAFANSEHLNPEELSYQIADLFITTSKEQVVVEKNSYQHSKKDLERFVGNYQELNSDLLMQVKIEKDTLRAKSSFGRHYIPLSPISKYRFYRGNDRSVVYDFSDNKGSEKQLNVNFGGATFYFEPIELVDPATVAIKDFVGEYYSEELKTTYRILEGKKGLELSYVNNSGISLYPSQKDEFGSRRRTKYSFNRNKKGKVVSFYVGSEGTVKNILFERQN